MQFICDGDEIPKWNRDKLWKCNLLVMMMKFQCGKETNCGKRNSFGEYGKIPMWNSDKYGKAIYLVMMMIFRCGIETIVEMQ